MPDLSRIGNRPIPDPAAATELLLRIIGRLISLFVHEMNNHLATLSETAGLGDDILNASSLNEKNRLKEMGTLLESMDSRIRRASSLVSTLDTFGSHMSACSSDADVNRAIEELMPFMTKVARQKNISVSVSSGSKVPHVFINQALLQCLIFALFENASASTDGNNTLKISSEASNSHIRISFLPADCRSSFADGLPWSYGEIENLSMSLMPGLDILHDSDGIQLTIGIQK